MRVNRDWSSVAIACAVAVSLVVAAVVAERLDLFVRCGDREEQILARLEQDELWHVDIPEASVSPLESDLRCSDGVATVYRTYEIAPDDSQAVVERLAAEADLAGWTTAPAVVTSEPLDPVKCLERTDSGTPVRLRVYSTVGESMAEVELSLTGHFDESELPPCPVHAPAG